MSTSTTPSDRYDTTDGTRAVRSDEPLVLSPDDYVVVDTRAPAEDHDRSVQRVTAARGSHTEDVGRRMRNYAFSMGVRTACVIGFVFAFPHWSAWLLVPGAVLLPYVAVILANAGRERTPAALAAVPTPDVGLPALRASGPA